jgi:hypothetical protein
VELSIAVAVISGAVLWALLRVGRDPSRSIVDMWRFRHPEWPSGVQEDDDLHWSWRGTAKEPDRHDADVVETPPDRVDVQPVSYEVRSADRPRS